MSRVHVLVEGRTEYNFLGQVLIPHLQKLGIYLSAKIVETGRLPSGHQSKGGISSYKRLRGDLRRLLNDSDAVLVTTMIDYYGLPKDFPGREGLVGTPDSYSKVERLEKSLRADLGSPRKLLPYLSLHEFEALLLSSPEHLDEEFGKGSTDSGFSSLLVSSKSPEEVNDGPKTHPAARIQALVPGYRKAFHGPLVATRIGLATIREKCPHFNQWVTVLESLGPAGL